MGANPGAPHPGGGAGDGEEEDGVKLTCGDIQKRPSSSNVTFFYSQEREAEFEESMAKGDVPVVKTREF